MATNTLEDLPVELVEKIIRHLSVSHYYPLSLVSTKLYHLLKRSNIWDNITADASFDNTRLLHLIEFLGKNKMAVTSLWCYIPRIQEDQFLLAISKLNLKRLYIAAKGGETGFGPNQNIVEQIDFSNSFTKLEVLILESWDPSFSLFFKVIENSPKLHSLTWKAKWDPSSSQIKDFVTMLKNRGSTFLHMDIPSFADWNEEKMKESFPQVLPQVLSPRKITKLECLKKYKSTIERYPILGVWLLHIFIRRAANLSLITYLVENCGVDVNSKSPTSSSLKWQPFYSSIEPITIGSVTRTVCFPVHVVLPGLCWRTLSRHRSLYVKILDYLLQRGANIDEINGQGYTLLALACMNHNPTAISFLLERKADPNVPDFFGKSPLSIFISTYLARKENSGRDAHQVVQMLIDHGANVNPKTHTPLAYACRMKHLPTVIKLIENGAYVTHEEQQWDPLCNLFRGDGFKKDTKENDVKDIATTLIQNGCDIAKENGKRGETALLTACKYGHWELAKFLIGLDTNGTSVNVCDAEGWSPTHYLSLIAATGVFFDPASGEMTQAAKAPLFFNGDWPKLPEDIPVSLEPPPLSLPDMTTTTTTTTATMTTTTTDTTTTATTPTTDTKTTSEQSPPPSPVPSETSTTPFSSTPLFVDTVTSPLIMDSSMSPLFSVTSSSQTSPSSSTGSTETPFTFSHGQSSAPRSKALPRSGSSHKTRQMTRVKKPKTTDLGSMIGDGMFNFRFHLPNMAIPETTENPTSVEASIFTTPVNIQTPVTTENPVHIETPATTEVSVTTEVPVTTETPTTTEVPVTTEVPIITETRATTEVPVTTEVPIITETPTTTEVPVTTEVPITTETPATTEVPITTETPVTLAITENPTTTEIPLTTENPTTTENLTTTEIPVTTETHVTTVNPTTTEIPVTTETHVTTENLTTTEIPVTTETHITTVNLTTTEIRVTTETLVTTENPTTRIPVTTETLVATVNPTTTEIGVTSENPTTTETLVPMESSSSTDNPVTTEAPITTETPLRIETSVVMETPVVTEYRSTTETPATTQNHTTTQNHMTTQNHTTTENHRTTEKHTTTEKYTTTEKNTPTENHRTTEKHTTTEKYTTTENPTTTEKHRITENHTTSENTTSSETPVITETHVPKETNVPMETPVTTEHLETTETPVPIYTPVPIETPVTPVPINTPVPIETPVTTDTPVPSETASTEGSVSTETPAATETSLVEGQENTLANPPPPTLPPDTTATETSSVEGQENTLANPPPPTLPPDTTPTEPSLVEGQENTLANPPPSTLPPDTTNVPPPAVPTRPVPLLPPGPFSQGPSQFGLLTNGMDTLSNTTNFSTPSPPGFSAISFDEGLTLSAPMPYDLSSPRTPKPLSMSSGKGAKFDIEDIQKAGALSVLKYLLNQGTANVNIANKQGSVPLMVVLDHPMSFDAYVVCEMLINFGAKVEELPQSYSLTLKSYVSPSSKK